MSKHLFTTIWLGITLSTVAMPVAQAGINLDEAEKVSLYGDIRLRLESDWDSARSSGTERNDRNRLRTRLRVGLNITPTDKIKVGVRLRSGSNSSHQSPHITLVDFDNNDEGDSDFNLDKWFASYSSGGATVWAGRNSLQFWKQNELFFDDDVTLAGIGGTWSAGNINVNAGYFSLPVGMQEFAGKLATGQLVYRSKVGERNDNLTVAAGVLAVNADSNDPDSSLLLDGNGARDYLTWVLSGQYKTTAKGRPLTFGVDYIHNSENYSATDPDSFTAFHADQTDGLVAQISYGSTKPGQWLAAYYYATIDTFAFSSSYSQDDWMRWGSATETRSTNFNGHEFRAAYGLMENMNIVARLYLVEANAFRSPAATTKEDGNRFRIDLNYRF